MHFSPFLSLPSYHYFKKFVCLRGDSYNALYLCLKQIVTLGMPSVSPISKVGTYVNPRDWNALISDPDTVSDQKFIAVVYPVIGMRITNKCYCLFQIVYNSDKFLYCLV